MYSGYKFFYLICIFKIFQPSLWLVFLFPQIYLSKRRNYFLQSLIYQIFFYAFMLFVLFKKICPTQNCKDFLMYFSLIIFYSFRFYIQICNLFWVNFCIWCDIRIKVHSVPCGYLDVLELFFENIILSLLNYLDTFVDNHMTIPISIYLYLYLFLNSFSCFIYISAFTNTTFS